VVVCSRLQKELKQRGRGPGLDFVFCDSTAAALAVNCKAEFAGNKGGAEGRK
jgi:hypothetical protein